MQSYIITGERTTYTTCSSQDMTKRTESGCDKLAHANTHAHSFKHTQILRHKDTYAQTKILTQTHTKMQTLTHTFTNSHIDMHTHTCLSISNMLLYCLFFQGNFQLRDRGSMPRVLRSHCSPCTSGLYFNSAFKWSSYHSDASTRTFENQGRYFNSPPLKAY